MQRQLAAHQLPGSESTCVLVGTGRHRVVEKHYLQPPVFLRDRQPSGRQEQKPSDILKGCEAVPVWFIYDVIKTQKQVCFWEASDARKFAAFLPMEERTLMAAFLVYTAYCWVKSYKEKSELNFSLIFWCNIGKKGQNCQYSIFSIFLREFHTLCPATVYSEIFPLSLLKVNKWKVFF